MHPNQTLQLIFIHLFLLTHHLQIVQIARANGIDVEDVQQDIAEFIIRHWSTHDPSQATFAAFVFGSIRKILRRQSIGAHRFALSLDCESDFGHKLREQVEAIPNDEEEDLPHTKLPGTGDLETIAEAINGRSTCQLAASAGITARHVRNLLESARETAKVQYSLFVQECAK